MEQMFFYYDLTRGSKGAKVTHMNDAQIHEHLAQIMAIDYPGPWIADTYQDMVRILDANGRTVTIMTSPLDALDIIGWAMKRHGIQGMTEQQILDALTKAVEDG